MLKEFYQWLHQIGKQPCDQKGQKGIAEQSQKIYQQTYYRNAEQDARNAIEGEGFVEQY
jgi:hypothetical protein